MKIRTLKNAPYAQCHVHEYRRDYGDSGNYDILVSYTTAVLCLDYDSHKVTCNGLYSRTTGKHISYFMREKGMNYYIAMSCYLNNLCYDFVTGDFDPLP